MSETAQRLADLWRWRRRRNRPSQGPAALEEARVIAARVRAGERVPDIAASMGRSTAWAYARLALLPAEERPPRRRRRPWPLAGRGRNTVSPERLPWSWGLWVREQRRRGRLTGAMLAEMAGITPPYVTLVERYGYVPTRDVVERIAESLGAPDEALLRAGYAPQHTLSALACPMLGLDPDLRAALAAVADLSPEERAGAAEVVRQALQEVR